MSHTKPPTPWWAIDSGGDTDDGVRCASCDRIACTCYLTCNGELASQLNPGQALGWTIWRRAKKRRR